MDTHSGRLEVGGKRHFACCEDEESLTILIPYRNRQYGISTLMLLFLSGRTNTQHSPSIAPSPIFLWRVFKDHIVESNDMIIVTGWHGFIIPVMCVNLASAINVSSPFSRSYFAHRYSIFCELLLGTALTLHTKGKTRFDIHSIKAGYLHLCYQGNVVRLNSVKIQKRCKQNNYFFSYVKIFF